MNGITTEGSGRLCRRTILFIQRHFGDQSLLLFQLLKRGCKLLRNVIVVERNSILYRQWSTLVAPFKPGDQYFWIWHTCDVWTGSTRSRVNFGWTFRETRRKRTFDRLLRHLLSSDFDIPLKFWCISDAYMLINTNCMMFVVVISCWRYTRSGIVLCSTPSSRISQSKGFTSWSTFRSLANQMRASIKITSWISVMKVYRETKRA